MYHKHIHTHEQCAKWTTHIWRLLKGSDSSKKKKVKQATSERSMEWGVSVDDMRGTMSLLLPFEYSLVCVFFFSHPFVLLIFLSWLFIFFFVPLLPRHCISQPKRMGMTEIATANVIGVVPFSLPNDIHIYINLQWWWVHTHTHIEYRV